MKTLDVTSGYTPNDSLTAKKMANIAKAAQHWSVRLRLLCISFFRQVLVITDWNRSVLITTRYFWPTCLREAPHWHNRLHGKVQGKFLWKQGSYPHHTWAKTSVSKVLPQCFPAQRMSWWAKKSVSRWRNKRGKLTPSSWARRASMKT